MGRAKGNDITLPNEIRFPHSLGLLYSAFTAFLGFQVNEGEYKVMGMAPYGQPRYMDKITDKLVRVADDGSFWLNMDYFSFHYSDEKTYSCKFVDLFGPPRDPKMHFFTSQTRFPSYFGEKPADFDEQCRLNEHYADIAASIQKVTEEIILKLASDLQRRTGLKKLCMAGGVALNSVANGRILRETPFEELFIQPAAGDSGAALGAALHVYHGLLGKPRSFTLEHAYWGKAYGEDEIRSFLEGQNIALRKIRGRRQAPRPRRRRPRRGQGRRLVPGPVRMGPAGPRQPEHPGRPAKRADEGHRQHQDQVPRAVPAVRPGHPRKTGRTNTSTGRNIAGQYPARYMLLVLPLKEDKADQVSAVNHMGTGRLQTIREEWNPRYYEIVEKFGQATGRARPPQHVVQPAGRADRHDAGQRLQHVQQERHRRPGPRKLHGPEIGSERGNDGRVQEFRCRSSASSASCSSSSGRTSAGG